MVAKHPILRQGIIGVMLAAVTLLHYITPQSAHHYHIFYRQLYFVPLFLAAFWFGLRGALATSLSIMLLYLPFMELHWENFSPDDFSQVLDIVLYNAFAVSMGILRDREVEEQRRSRKEECLAAMGKALLGVAHDMRTPLIAIGGFSRLIQGHLTTHGGSVEEYCRDKLEIIIKETRRLENMVQDMLDFARPLQLHRSRESIDQILEESVTIVQAVAEEKGVILRNAWKGPVPPVCLDPLRIKQVFLNLLLNAVQASPEGETVRVNCRRGGAKLMIDITDHGCGIPVEKRQEIFVPFFTTKKDGTGLGLCIVKKIVEAHEGHLEILDNSEKGLTFRVVLPFSEDCSTGIGQDGNTPAH